MSDKTRIRLRVFVGVLLMSIFITIGMIAVIFALAGASVISDPSYTRQNNDQLLIASCLFGGIIIMSVPTYFIAKTLSKYDGIIL